MNSENINNTSLDSEEISLKALILSIREWWNYLLSRWLIITAFGLVGGVLGFTYAHFKKPVYTATTTFVLEDEKGESGLGNLAGLASIAGVDLGGSGGGIFQGDNILSLYKSRAMIEKTLLTEVNLDGKKQLLIDLYIDFNQLRKAWAKNPGLKAIQFNTQVPSPQSQTQNIRLRDSIIGIIVADINANFLNVSKPDKELSIINAEVKAKDEVFAKIFNDEIVKNVNNFYIQTKTKKSLDNISILKQKTDSVRAVMNGAIYSAAVVADATPNLNPTRQIQRLAPVQKAQFSAETNKAILSTLVQNLEMSKMNLMKEAPLIQVIDRPIYPLKKDGFGKVKGILLGGILAGFLTVIFLSITKVLKDIMA